MHNYFIPEFCNEMNIKYLAPEGKLTSTNKIKYISLALRLRLKLTFHF